MPITYRTELPPAAAYHALFETTGWYEDSRLTRDELERAIAQSWFAVAAWDGEDLVAFGRVMSDGVLHAMIYDMIVRPDCQRRGIGSRVLTMLVDRCQEAGIRDVQLFCARGKRGFYERHGFRERRADAPGMELASEV